MRVFLKDSICFECCKGSIIDREYNDRTDFMYDTIGVSIDQLIL